MASKTSFEDKCSILADLWLNYRSDPDFADFIEYNDIGLPLAYVISNEIVEETETARRFVEETFDLLLEGLELDDEDTAYETLDDMFEAVEDDDSESEDEPTDLEESGKNLPERFRDISNGE